MVLSIAFAVALRSLEGVNRRGAAGSEGRIPAVAVLAAEGEEPPCSRWAVAAGRQTEGMRSPWGRPVQHSTLVAQAWEVGLGSGLRWPE